MSSVRGDREETGTPLAAKPELELSLFLFLYFDSHQIHAGSLGGGFWPEINASAIFFLSLFFFGATCSSTSGGKQKVPKFHIK